jgi:hypothetical protein
MNTYYKIFFVVVLIIFAGKTSFAQSGSQLNDTLKLNIKKTESTRKAEDQNTKEVNNNQADKGNNNVETHSMKNVKAARPDMSKARGARPPSIVRPTGSRFPNGLGRPGGAIRPGHG